MKKVNIVFCLIIITISLCHTRHTGKVIQKNGNCECGILPHPNSRFKRQQQLTSLGFQPMVQSIVKGFKTKINEYPWVVGLHSDLNCRKTPVCGGALISSQHVITAAHCVEEGLIQCISLGDHDFTTETETVSIKRGYLDASKYDIIHPDYFGGSQKVLPKNDIAMLTLDEAVDFAKYPHIRPICLPDPTEDLQEGIDVIVSGWGRIGSGSGQSRESLKGAKLKTVSNKDCQQSYTRYKDTLQDTHICAYGEDGSDACQGDSGGPLFAMRPSLKKKSNDDQQPRMELVGVTSFGQKCGLQGKPGGYTRANKFIKWIMNAMTTITPKVEVCNGFFGNWVSRNPGSQRG